MPEDLVHAGEDGAAWLSVPQRYADLNKSIDERFPIGNPAQKRQLDFWREQNTFNQVCGQSQFLDKLYAKACDPSGADPPHLGGVALALRAPSTEGELTSTM